MNGRIDSGLGQIVIDTDVIATYAGSVAVECFGIIGMAAVSMKDGLVKLLFSADGCCATVLSNCSTGTV